MPGWGLQVPANTTLRCTAASVGQEGQLQRGGRNLQSSPGTRTAETKQSSDMQEMFSFKSMANSSRPCSDLLWLPAALAHIPQDFSESGDGGYMLSQVSWPPRQSQSLQGGKDQMKPISFFEMSAQLCSLQQEQPQPILCCPASVPAFLSLHWKQSFLL